MKAALKKQIEALIGNGYAETEIGYHAEFRSFQGGEFQRGCYAQIAAPYGGMRRVYATSYAELLVKVESAVASHV